MIEADCGAERLGQPALTFVMQRENLSALNYSSVWLHFRPDRKLKAADHTAAFEESATKQQMNGRGGGETRSQIRSAQAALCCSGGCRVRRQKVGRHMTACHLRSLVTVSHFFHALIFLGPAGVRVRGWDDSAGFYQRQTESLQCPRTLSQRHTQHVVVSSPGSCGTW